jgi:hypothetical protein
MNAGFSNLSLLKQHLLPPALQNQGTYDQVILDLGLGVQGMFERFCNRKFAREAGDTYQTGAERVSLVVPRYPIESLTSLDHRADLTAGWESLTLNDYVLNWDPDSGLVIFGSEVGDANTMLRLTYTGGYWWSTTEPGEAEAAQPSGSTLLPDALRTAWLLQVRQAWTVIDKLGGAIGNVPTKTSYALDNLAALKLVPQVEQMLWAYQRHSF